MAPPSLALSLFNIHLVSSLPQDQICQGLWEPWKGGTGTHSRGGKEGRGRAVRERGQRWEMPGGSPQKESEAAARTVPALAHESCVHSIWLEDEGCTQPSHLPWLWDAELDFGAPFIGVRLVKGRGKSSRDRGKSACVEAPKLQPGCRSLWRGHCPILSLGGWSFISCLLGHQCGCPGRA